MPDTTNKQLKFSIIIPTYNGVSYLPTCIETITSQQYSDYELIVSDDHSDDGTREYLATLSHPNIKTLTTPYKMSMSEHWEWALAHACGEWNIFVGQDDGLQPYFFSLADTLTNHASALSIRTIMSERAYYFWPGCEKILGDTAISYNASFKITKCSASKKMFQTLAGLNNYFELPEMYTTSLFHRDLLNEARSKQSHKVFVTHPQDANLAAIACSLDTHYLQSSIPLGWVGTSVKSAGMALSANTNKELSENYLNKIQHSQLEYSSQLGYFSLGLCSLYFWGALLQTDHLRSQKINSTLRSTTIKYLVFLSALLELQKEATASERRTEFYRVVALNNCSLQILLILFPFYKLTIMFSKITIKVLKRVAKMMYPKVSYHADQHCKISMLQANTIISRKISTTNFNNII